MQACRIVIAALFAATAAHADLPLTAFGQLPGIDHIELSPDGSKFAALYGDETKAQIQVRSVATGELILVTAADKAKVRNLQWAGEDRLLALVSTTKRVNDLVGAPRREWMQIQSLSLATRKWSRILDGIPDTMNTVDGDPTVISVEGNQLAVLSGTSFILQQGFPTLFQVNLDKSNTVKTLEVAPPSTVDWIVGPTGAPVARAEYDPVSFTWQLSIKRQKEWVKVYSEVAPIDMPTLIGLGRNSSTILVGSRTGGKYAVHELKIDDPVFGPPLPDLNPDGLIFDPANRAVIASTASGLDTVTYHFFDPADQKKWDAIAKAFPGELVTLASWSADRSTIVIEVQGPTNGDGFYIIDLKTKKASPLAVRYPGITPDQIGERHGFHYRAADGLDIPAYLTLPRGRTAKALPLVVLVHGGPASRDDPGFDWWAQGVASRGYAVLQPQFRGSDGFGDAHLAAGFGQWGRRMQSDLSDGVRALVDRGLVDPRRVCIVGASYGGYAALAGVTLQQGIYRCAASVAGVSDVRQFLTDGRSIDKEHEGDDRYWQRFAGTASLNDPALDAISPARQAKFAKVPILLVHGKDDTVVPFEQSMIMQKALQKAGTPVELVTLKAEDHWLSRGATRVQMLEAVVSFLERNNSP